VKEKDDGGSAFPFGQISENTGQPINGYFAPGMTLRDWFAGQTLGSLIDLFTSGKLELKRGGRPTEADISEQAYAFADAMLKVRKEDK